jgi:hypothetical protein
MHKIKESLFCFICYGCGHKENPCYFFVPKKEFIDNGGTFPQRCPFGGTKETWMECNLKIVEEVEEEPMTTIWIFSIEEAHNLMSQGWTMIKIRRGLAYRSYLMKNPLSSF